MDDKPRVYVVQQHLKKNDDGVLVPKYDLSPAAKFGELRYVMGTDANPYDADPQRDLDRIRRQMRDIQDGDFILPIGSTLFISLVAIVAAEYCEQVTFLYWHGRQQEYRATTYNLAD